MTEIRHIRDQFPILQAKANGRPLVYLDNAATTQKPSSVIEAITGFYRNYNSNIHRGVHYLSQQATSMYEAAREHFRQFLNARSEREIIFTRGTTDAINLVADSFSREYLHEGDEVVVSVLEHHSNFVPWQMACEKRHARFRVLPADSEGKIDLNMLGQMINDRTRMLALTHVSNVLGIVNPVKEIVNFAHLRGVKVLIDGAQAVLHRRIDVQQLDCDFYCFSGHKAYGPMGVGILYGKEELLEKMPPYQGGGEMIEEVSATRTTYNSLPFKYEAGTPNVADVIAMEAALGFMEQTGFDFIENHEHAVVSHAMERLAAIPGLHIYGGGLERAGVISFNINGVHPYDLGVLLDQMGIAVRTGHHCAQPLMDHLGIPGTVRASFAVYNTTEEADQLAEAVKRAVQMLL